MDRADFEGIRKVAAEPLGAGSVVTRDVPPRSVAAGNPCRVLREITEADRELAFRREPAERDYASVLADAPAHAYFGQCTYCGHCQPCVMGIDIAAVNKFADLAKMQDEVPDSVRAHYRQLPATAADCIGCASCEPNCPFGVPIAARMAEAAALFGC